MKKFIAIIAALLLACCAVFADDDYSAYYGQLPTGGNSYSTSDVRKTLDKTYYVGSFRTLYGIPEWTIYTTTKAKVSEKAVNRYTGNCKTDGVAPVKVTYKDYNNSGYAKGHIAPIDDLRYSYNAQISSFYMSNICPMPEKFNTTIWAALESRATDLIIKYGKATVIQGPVLDKAYTEYENLKDDTASTTTKMIVIPTQYYKIIYCYATEDNGLEKPIVYAYLVDTTVTSASMPSQYKVTVDSIEELTGLDFFSELPDDLEEALESTIEATN